MKKVLVFAGTRPEAIKVASVVTALQARPDVFTVRLCATGQHKEMLLQAFADLALMPDINLELMQAGQTLAMLSSRLLEAVDALLEKEQPDLILVQGDTTTVQVASLCAFYRHIPVGHIEAGLRSGDIRSPFPEELNRRITSLVASWHFAPTEQSRQNLLAEHVSDASILVTGNTVIDSLLWMRDQIRKDPPSLPAEIEDCIARQQKIILVTGHRRENFGEGFKNICLALCEIAEKFPDTRIVYPVHLNPNVRNSVMEHIGTRPGVILTEPLSYKPFIRLMDASHIVLTDSGGIQEEAPSFCKPVLVMRDNTERPEGVEAGVSRLTGTASAAIVSAVARLLADKEEYRRMSTGKNPYGDGLAGERIAGFLAAP